MIKHMNWGAADRGGHPQSTECFQDHLSSPGSEQVSLHDYYPAHLMIPRSLFTDIVPQWNAQSLFRRYWHVDCRESEYFTPPRGKAKMRSHPQESRGQSQPSLSCSPHGGEGGGELCITNAKASLICQPLLSLLTLKGMTEPGVALKFSNRGVHQ